MRKAARSYSELGAYLDGFEEDVTLFDSSMPFAAGALALTRVMQAFLFHVSSTDGLTFTGIGLLLVLLALAGRADRSNGGIAELKSCSAGPCVFCRDLRQFAHLNQKPATRK